MAFRALPPAFLMPFFTAFLAAFLTRFTTVPVKVVIALSIPSGDADWLKLAHLYPHHTSTES